MAFALDCHDREVPAWVASPRPLTEAAIRTLMDRTLWARFGETQWLSDNDPVHGDGYRALRACARPRADHHPGL